MQPSREDSAEVWKICWSRRVWPPKEMEFRLKKKEKEKSKDRKTSQMLKRKRSNIQTQRRNTRKNNE